MLNTVHFDPWQRSLFVPSVSSANTKEKGPLLAGNYKIEKDTEYMLLQGRQAWTLSHGNIKVLNKCRILNRHGQYHIVARRSKMDMHACANRLLLWRRAPRLRPGTRVQLGFPWMCDHELLFASFWINSMKNEVLSFSLKNQPWVVDCHCKC